MTLQTKKKKSLRHHFKISLSNLLYFKADHFTNPFLLLLNCEANSERKLLILFRMRSEVNEEWRKWNSDLFQSYYFELSHKFKPELDTMIYFSEVKDVVET